MIRVKNLTKSYRERLAVDDISFAVGKGEIVGFLGPNGAGKTTTMRMLTGYLMPSRGDVWIGEYNMAAESLAGRRLVGYLPEKVPLYTDMTTRSYLAYAARLRGLDRKLTKVRIEAVVATCGLADYVDVILEKLSKGYRQRVGLAQAIVHDPEVLILDEPTAGIDPLQVAQTKALITELGKDRTILLSTHILPDVSAICERVIIINNGRIVAEDRIDNLSDMMKTGKRLRLTTDGPAKAVSEALSRIDMLLSVTFEKPHHFVDYSFDQEPQAAITRVMVERGWTLLAMEPAGMGLEDIFLKLTDNAGNIH